MTINSGTPTKIFQFVSKWQKSRVGRNILSLYVIQFANYILPLITLPYLVRVLGPEKFGVVAFVQSLIAYFVLIVNYGFNWTATRKISLLTGDIKEVSRIASNVWLAKILLCMMSIMILSILVGIVPRLSEVSELVFILYGIVIGNILFPVWLYQGLERMVSFSLINLSVRVISTIGIFALIHDPTDYIIYAGLLSLQWLGAGFIAVCFAYTILELQFIFPSWIGAREELKEGWMLFLSKGAIGIYTVGNAFILGMLTNNSVVGYYIAAEKIVRATQGLLEPINQAIYPRFSKIATISKELTLMWARRVLFVEMGIGFLISAFLFFSATFITNRILDPAFEPAINIIRILAPLPFIVSISAVFGIQIMLPFKHDKAFTQILISAVFVNIILGLILTSIWDARGMAFAVLCTESIIVVVMWLYLTLHKLNPFQKTIIK